MLKELAQIQWAGSTSFIDELKTRTVQTRYTRNLVFWAQQLQRSVCKLVAAYYVSWHDDINLSSVHVSYKDNTKMTIMEEERMRKH